MSLNSIFSHLTHSFFTNCDAPEPWQLGFQDPATPAMEGMIDFHDYIMVFFNRYCCICFMDVNSSIS